MTSVSSGLAVSFGEDWGACAGDIVRDWCWTKTGRAFTASKIAAAPTAETRRQRMRSHESTPWLFLLGRDGFRAVHCGRRAEKLRVSSLFQAIATDHPVRRNLSYPVHGTLKSQQSCRLFYQQAGQAVKARDQTSVASRKPSSWRIRVGWRILRSAFASIWRMRSRVTLNWRPTSSSVRL